MVQGSYRLMRTTGTAARLGNAPLNIALQRTRNSGPTLGVVRR
jgi:hypothetical protein